jgi:CDP-glycerol glycerophosphotransferase (TagB/SpsB family)
VDKFVKKTIRGMNLLMSIVIYFLSVFLKNKNITIYGAWRGERFSDNPKYLFIEANKRKNKNRNIWISKNEKVVDEVRNMGYEAYYAYSLKGIFFQLTAGKAVLCMGLFDFYSPLLGGKKILQLWHGIPLKKIMYDSYSPNFCEKLRNKFLNKNTYVLYTSKHFKDIYMRAFDKTEDYLICSGQPRNDIFYDGTLIDKDMEKRLEGIIKGRKMILYMPTHRNAGAVKMDMNVILNLDNINSVCQENNAVFIINKHFCHKNEPRIDGYESICEITDTGFDSQFLLAKADVLITDYSSCYIDYLLREKPIIFYQYDLEWYKKNDRELYFEDGTVTPGRIVTEKNELDGVLKDVIQGVSVYDEAETEKIKNFFYDEDNQCIVSAKVLDLWEKV